MRPTGFQNILFFGLCYLIIDIHPVMMAQTPVFQSLELIMSISGKKTLAGQHNKEPNADPDRWTRYIHEITGKYPALWSGDFLFQQENIDTRWNMIHEAKDQWDHGAVINLMWHACPPDEGEPCGWDPGLLNARLTDDQWRELTTDGTPLNERWKARMDDIAIYLRYLEDQPRWVFFMPWAELVKERNSVDQILEIYNDPDVLTRDEMPGWN